MVVDRQEFERIEDEYCRVRGWDASTVLETGRRLEDVGLSDPAATLRETGLVA